MILAMIQVSGVCARATFRRHIPHGIIGAQVQFDFDANWDGLQKTAVFRGCVTKDVLMEGNVVTIPPETIAQPVPKLEIGVYGTSADGTIAIPTLWANIGRVLYATDPSGDPTTDETLPVWAQMHNRIVEMEEKVPKLVQEATPQRGKDYWTPEDKKSIVSETKEEIGIPTPSPEVAGKALIANGDGTGFEFGKAVGGVNVTGATPGQMILVKAVDEEGKPTQWEAVDRTHYSEIAEITIYSCENQVPDPDMGAVAVMEVFPFTDGMECTVNWKGTDYICTCACMNTEESTYAIGNIAAASGDGDSGEPFLIVTYGNEGFSVIVPMDGSASVTVTITAQMETVKKIPEKYLPEMNGGAYIVSMGVEGSYIVLLKDDLTTIIDHLKNGDHVVGDITLGEAVRRCECIYWTESDVEFSFHSGDSSGLDYTRLEFSTNNAYPDRANIQTLHFTADST